PEKFEFLFDPRDAFGRFVLPQDLIVALPPTTGLVQRTYETELPPISQRDNPCFTVHEAADLIGCHTYSVTVLFEIGVETAVAVPLQQRLGLESTLAPTT